MREREERCYVTLLSKLKVLFYPPATMKYKEVFGVEWNDFEV
jgi:hypothetical protein